MGDKNVMTEVTYFIMLLRQWFEFIIEDKNKPNHEQSTWKISFRFFTELKVMSLSLSGITCLMTAFKLIF